MPKTKYWQPGNGLLADLAPEICERLQRDLVEVELPQGRTIYAPDVANGHVFFLREGLVSLLAVLENGDTGEVAMVGKEGMVGVSLLVDSQSTPTRAVVQVGGSALALPAEALANEFRLGGDFQRAVLRYTQALIAQMTQVSMCTRRHPVPKQLSRWLLMAGDRAGPIELPLTHEAIAHLLGVRREGITEAAGKLQAAGLIRNSRGRIQVTDRERLLASSCECYESVGREYARLLDARPA